MALRQVEEDSDVEEEALLLVTALLLRKRSSSPRTIWVHETLKKRKELGEYHRLAQELKLDSARFFQYFRMSTKQFSELLQMVAPQIHKVNTNYRESLSDEQRLGICLRFLATGDSFRTIAFSYRVGGSTVGLIVEETCEAIWTTLMDRYMPVPTEQSLKHVAEQFFINCNFPNCIGAIDGKHIIIQAPWNSESLYFNYKGTFSVVLMAIVDSNYNFIAIDVGSYGSNSDGGILSQSSLGKALANGSLHIPPPLEFVGAGEMGTQPHVLVGDEAFPLKSYLLRPFPGGNLDASKRIYNYRLSRARRMVDCAFGLLAQRWRIYQRRMQVHEDKAVKIIKATCILNNFVQQTHATDDESVAAIAVDNPVNNSNHASMHDINHFAGNRPTLEATIIRDAFKDYFSSATGEVPWQYAIAGRGLSPL